MTRSRKAPVRRCGLFRIWTWSRLTRFSLPHTVRTLTTTRRKQHGSASETTCSPVECPPSCGPFSRALRRTAKRKRLMSYGDGANCFGRCCPKAHSRGFAVSEEKKSKQKVDYHEY